MRAFIFGVIGDTEDQIMQLVGTVLAPMDEYARRCAAKEFRNQHPKATIRAISLKEFEDPRVVEALNHQVSK